MWSNLPKLDNVKLPERNSGLSFCRGDRVQKPGIFLRLEGEVVRVLSRQRRLYRVKWDGGWIETVPGDHLVRG